MTDDRHTDPVAALGRLAAVPVDADDRRLDALGERIADAIAEDDGAMVVPFVPGRRRRVVAAGLAAACVVLVIAVAATLLRPSDDSIVIAFADDVTITLDDGSTIDGASGVALPEGAMLDVAGSVVIDGDRFGPGEYLVDDGELVPVGEPAPATVPTGDVGDGSDEVPATDVPSPTSTTLADRDEVAPVVPEPDDGDVTATTDQGATSATRPPVTDAPTTTLERPSDETRPVDRTTVPTTETRPTTTTPVTRPSTTTAPSTTEATRPTDETRPERTTTTTTRPARDR